MSVDNMEGTSAVQTRDEPTSVDSGNSEFFTATEASSSHAVTAISSSASACQYRARPSSETLYSSIQSTKEHDGECSADVPMTTGEQTAEANSESTERVAEFLIDSMGVRAKIALQVSVGLKMLHDMNKDMHIDSDIKPVNLFINNHRQRGGRYKPKR